MTTLPQIVGNLQKVADDKKDQLTDIYKEISKWLAKELDGVRELIDHSPREDLPAVQKKDESHGKKRKSPEAALVPVKLSPDQKRASVDCEALQQAAGLPADLNKLKKESLLEELAKRGDTSLTMKSLKKDMVEGLKNLLIQASRADAAVCESVPMSDTPARPEDSEERPEELLEDRLVEVHVTSEEVAEAPAEQPSATEEVEHKEADPALAPLPKTPGRKGGSLMADFRSILNTVAVAPPAAPVDVQGEFQARQSRFRDSQLRKSQLLALPSAEEVQQQAVEQKEEVEEKEDEPTDPTPAPVLTLLPPRTPEVVTMADLQVDDAPEMAMEVVAKEEVQEDERIWQEVTSDSEHEEEEEEAQAEEVREPEEEVKEIVRAPSNLLTSSVTSFVPAKGKPLAGTGASFLDKPAAPKPVVAALEKARKAKEAEEARALQKRKDAEARAATKGLNLNSSLNSTGGSSTSSKSTTSTSAKVTAPAPAAAPVKKGLFGGLFGKKPAMTAPVAAAAPAPEPVAAAAPVPAPTPVPAPATSPAPMTHIAKSAISSIVQNYNNALASPTKGPTGMTMFQAPSPRPINPPTTPAASSSAVKQVLKEIPVPLVTPSKGPAAPAEPVEYQIEDRESSDDESASDSGTDEEDEKGKKPAQVIPEWAKPAKLKEALERQYGLDGHKAMDPDTIFHEVVTCSLEEIFGPNQSKSRYHHRTSSAHWDADKLTLVEKRQYRNHMGYDGQAGKV